MSASMDAAYDRGDNMNETAIQAVAAVLRETIPTNDEQRARAIAERTVAAATQCGQYDGIAVDCSHLRGHVGAHSWA